MRKPVKKLILLACVDAYKFWPDIIAHKVRCEQIFDALEKKYGMRNLEGLTWTDGATKFDASFPDQ